MGVDSAVLDVVIVSYNSRDCLRRAASEVAEYSRAHVIVVDNDSHDDSLETVSDLAITTIGLRRNGGFAHGCNVGMRIGVAPYVLFLNPDATIDPASLAALVACLDSDPEIGAVGPRILDDDGSLALTQRLFPRTLTVLAQAFFLHRLPSGWTWTDDVVRDPALYERERSVEWLSGACILLRRDVLEQLGGLDEGFFHYCEDMDLCRRIRDLGCDIRYVPAATAVHVGGHSAPRTSLLPRLMASKLRYAEKHRGTIGRSSERFALATYALTHAAVPTSAAARHGHRRALMVNLRGGIPE